MAILLNLEEICGICLQESTDMCSIFDNDDMQIKISEKIGKCFPEFNSFQEQNKLYGPSSIKICDMCLQDLDAAYRFHNNCETALLLFGYTPISEDIDNDSFVQIKSINKERVVESPSLEEMQKIEPLEDDSSNTQTQDTEKTEYADFCELEQLDYAYDEEHLDEIGEAPYEAMDQTTNIESDTESSALEIETQNQIDQSSRPETLSPIEVDAMITNRKRIKSKNSYVPNFKSQKKSKEKCGPKICELCGNTYKYQHALNSHMRRHMNDKPFNCECCDKAFVSNVELRRHMRVHTGDKPYACSYCERRFSDYGSRIKHERTHTGERPFVCQTCHKSFAYAHVLSVHLRTHTGEKKFQCTQCGKGFTKKSYMLAHMEQHRRSALLVLKEEEESHDTFLQEQTRPILSSVLDNSEGSLEPCITTYIVEEIDGENNELKDLKNIDEVEDQLQNVVGNESILSFR